MSGDFFDPGDPAGQSNLSGWRNPLIGRGAGRQILQIPFDDSIDGTSAVVAARSLECFFQMPSQVKGIRAAQLWVQAKPFRQYVGAASSSGGGTAHKHGIDTAFANPGGNTASQSTSSTSSGDVHSHTDHSHTGSFAGATTGANPLLNSQGAHGHTLAHTHGLEYFIQTIGESPIHTHPITTTLTPGVFETTAAGTLSLYVADDGVNYGAAIVSSVAVATGITKQTLLPQLTKASGDKRIKITGTGLCRLQVLLLLDLRVSVLS